MVFDQDSYENEVFSNATVEGRLSGVAFTLCAFKDMTFPPPPRPRANAKTKAQPKQERQPRLDFGDAESSGAMLPESASEPGPGVPAEKPATARNCTFTRCAFIGTSFKDAVFERCAFDSCFFKQADLMRATFRDCRLIGAQIVGARVTGMTVEGGDWSYANLANLKFSRQKLTKVCLHEASLAGAVFKECDLSGCDLTRATVQGARFEACDLRGSRIDGVAVEQASWKDSKIDLAQCIVIAQEVTGAVFDEAGE